jgi:hypothetical protein
MGEGRQSYLHVWGQAKPTHDSHETHTTSNYSLNGPVAVDNGTACIISIDESE